MRSFTFAPWRRSFVAPALLEAAAPPPNAPPMTPRSGLRPSFPFQIQHLDLSLKCRTCGKQANLFGSARSPRLNKAV